MMRMLTYLLMLVDDDQFQHFAKMADAKLTLTPLVYYSDSL